MACLVLPRAILAEMRRIVFRTTHETGVRLVGEAAGQRYMVRHLIGPGPRAVRRSDRYECDNRYAEDRYNELLKGEPRLEFLGELHVHPPDDARLSRQDLATVRKVLRDLPFFIAGTIRRRPFALSPVLFGRRVRRRLRCVLR